MKLWFFKDPTMLELRSFLVFADTPARARELIVQRSDDPAGAAYLRAQLALVDPESFDGPLVIDMYDNVVGRAFRPIEAKERTNR